MGNMAAADDSGTFWGATRMILDELYAVLKPGGVMASVTGDYRRDHKRVYFGRQWCAAAEAAGFVLIAHAVAWKVKRHPDTHDLFGAKVAGKKVEHLGMFRKMDNAKHAKDDPDAAIESEGVWFLQKPFEEVENVVV